MTHLLLGCLCWPLAAARRRKSLPSILFGVFPLVPDPRQCLPCALPAPADPPGWESLSHNTQRWDRVPQRGQRLAKPAASLLCSLLLPIRWHHVSKAKPVQSPLDC